MVMDIPLDIRKMSAESLDAVIQSDEVCEVTGKGRQLLLRYHSLSLEILKYKFETFFTKNLYRFMGEQIRCFHVIDEAFLSKRAVCCAASMVFSILMIQGLIVKRMGNLIKSRRNLKKLEEEEGSEALKCIKDYIVEKIMVLLFCIVRSNTRKQHKRYIDFGEYVHDSISLHNGKTDITLFACYYCLLAICHVSTNSIFRRFIKTIPYLERSLMTRLRGQSVFIAMFVTLCLFVAYSAILLGGAIVSIAFIHPDYSTILILECFRQFIRSLYSLDRLAQCVSSNFMNEIERQRHLTDKEVAEIVGNGYQYNYSRWNVRSIYAVSTLFINFLLYVYYTITGLFFHRKMFASRFLLDANQVVKDFANIAEYDPTHLL
ncbi:hypothetical protein CAEBREN_01645 [Caenorhabditis brenneri]|uniref:Gustatory receptor n=1 Tax=Caenorhabditis brenneri TaxID=135651 RepID=G0MNQ3_CAEBE|nr:hypothetical protein CAEBREN_01645 [Caenorhabditis brenneri]